MQLGINSDISKFKRTIKGSATSRTILVTIIIVIVTATVFFGLYKYLDTNPLAIIIMLLDGPIAAFYLEEIPIFGLPAEKVLRLMVLYLFAPRHSITASADDFKEETKASMIFRNLAKYKYNVPKTIQQFIPLDEFYDDGMARNGSRYSVCYFFSDVDSKTLADDDKINLLKKYEGILSTFTDVFSAYKISVISRNIPSQDIYEKMKVPDFPYNPELTTSVNEIIEKNIINKNQQYSDLMLTITSLQQSEDDARIYFQNIEGKLFNKFYEIGSSLKRLTLSDRISLYHFLNHPGSDVRNNYDSATDMRHADIKNYCCPALWKVHRDHIEIGSSFYRIMYLQNVGNSIEDDFWRNITANIPNISISTMEIAPIENNTAKNMANRAVANSAAKISDYRSTKTKSGDISSYVPPSLQHENDASRELYEDLNARKQGLYMCTVFIAITAPTLEELENSTNKIQKTAKEQSCNYEILYYQQVPGLFSCLPYGISNPIEERRALTTESIAAFIPFSARMIQSFGPKALWEGSNPINRKINSIDRSNLPNGNGLIFGDSGSGKSVQAKLDIIQRRIKERDNADIIILDPKGEYSILAKTHGGTTVNISVDSKDNINIMDVTASYGASETGGMLSPIKRKIAFLQDFIALMTGEDVVPRPFLNSIIDRCCATVYRNYAKNHFQGEAPTLKDLYGELKNQKQNKEHAEQIALAIETFAFGSLSVFAEQTNVKPEDGFIVYDIHELDDSFKVYGLMVMLDQVLNRVSKNFAEGKYTYIYIDEFHKFFGTPAEPLIMDLWKMGRAMHCFSTGITQNITDVLSYQNGVLIVHNSEYLKILKCSKMEILEDLSRILDIPPQLLPYIQGSDAPEQRLRASSGVIKYANTIVPFVSEIPHESYLYQIINSD